VLVAVFTIVFTLGYATYRAYSAATTLRSLDQNLETMDNMDDPTPLLEQALGDFSETDGYGPPTGFGMIRGKYLVDLKWIPGLPTINVVAFTILPGSVLASNSDFSGAQQTYTAENVGDVNFLGDPRAWSSFKNPMLPETCSNSIDPANDPLHCIDIPNTTIDLMQPSFPKAHNFEDNCDTDLGPFIATTGTGNDEHDIIPNDCFADGINTEDCHANKLQHAAAYITQFVLPVDANGGCAAGNDTLLLLPHENYPAFVLGGDY